MGNQQQKAQKPKPLNPTELQTYIMVTQVKLNQGRNKKIALIKKKQDEIIKHLNDNNLDIAKAKMESLMREEDYITVYDILGPLCEILKEKVTYIMTSKECPADLRASLDTLIYSSTRLEIEELHMIREFIKQKFTNIYVDKANSNIDKLVNINVVDKLTVKPYPEAELICRLKGICEREDIQFSFPQLANPLIVDPNMNNKNITIPTIPNFNNMDNTQGMNMGNYPTNMGGYGYTYPNNNNNMNINNTNIPGNTMQMGNTFPQGNANYPGPQFTGQYTMYSNNYIPQQTMPNLSTINNPNLSNINNNGNLDGSGNSSFSSIPNNFSAGNSQPNPNNSNSSPNMNVQPQAGINYPSNYSNNINIPPMNINSINNNNKNDYSTMPRGNNTFPQEKGDISPMMSSGFSPIMTNNEMNNTFPQGKVEANNDGFPSMGAATSITQNNTPQSFPNINNPNFGSIDDLEFPSSKKN